MTPILYDFLSDIHNVIMSKGLFYIHGIQVFFNLDTPSYQLLHYRDAEDISIEYQYFSCKNIGDLKLDLEEYVPLILEENWVLWDDYFSVLYEKFKRLKAIDEMLLTL